MFRRKPAAEVETTSEVVDESTDASARSRATTVSKRDLGVVTPKRTSSSRKAGPATPTDRKEAAAVTRDSRRQERKERQEAMARGESWALMPRDRGPEKLIARNIVDTRRSPSSYIMFLLIFVLLVSTFFARAVPAISLAAYGVFIIAIIATVIDGILINRKVKSTILAKYPNANLRGIGFYSAMRATQIRALRMPRPNHRPGDQFKI